MFHSWPIRPEAQDVIGWLQRSGYAVCLITGSVGIYAKHIAERLGVADYYANAELYFDKNGDLNDFRYAPNQAAVKLKQLEQFCASKGFKPGECMAVGDSDNDIALFKQTGHGVLIEGEKVADELRAAAWKTVHNLIEIKKLLGEPMGDLYG